MPTQRCTMSMFYNAALTDITRQDVRFTRHANQRDACVQGRDRQRALAIDISEGRVNPTILIYSNAADSIFFNRSRADAAS